MRAVATELGIPERTATHWITKARNAGLLDGITYAVGRQPSGRRTE
jgi:transposase